MANSRDRQEATRWLSNSTKYGIWKSERNNARLVQLGGEPLTPDFVEKSINKLGNTNIELFAQKLLDSRVDLTGLPHADILKLRATLLLGLGTMRLEEFDLRASALTRTYRSQARLSPPEKGVDSYRKESRISRPERSHLLAQIIDALSSVQMSSAPYPTGETFVDMREEKVMEPPALASSHLAGGGYFLVEFQDEHWIAAGESDANIVVRRRLLRASRDGVGQFRQQYWANWKGRGEPRKNATAIGGKLEIVNTRAQSRDGVDGYIYDVVITFPPLNQNETHEISWTMEHPVSDDYLSREGRTHWVGIQPSLKIEHSEIALHFPKSKQPVEARMRTNVAANDASIIDSSDTVLRPHYGVIKAKWDYPSLGRFSGIVWEW